ncbi:MAG: hypothetical protein H0T42_15795 [Deltaproteobacteria bacterium]|nr:hypothetical protein [Deltaproteobacteria bacterium]
MMTANRVLRHSWISCVLFSLGGCGGMQKTAYSPGGSAHSSSPVAARGDRVATSAGPSHVSIDRGGGGGYIAEPVPDRPGLGTSWGETVSAPISFSAFHRSATTPWAEVALHYNDAHGVQAHASYLGSHPAPLEVFTSDRSLSVALVDEAGRTLEGYTAGGRALVIGNDGARYKIVVRNGTTARFEVVASVDGLDVIDGQVADPNRRGYIVEPHDVLVIDGFRTSDDAVAAFRFGKVADSYAAQTSGDRNVGIVGLAIFSERGAVWSSAELGRRDSADPFPNRGYATPPR